MADLVVADSSFFIRAARGHTDPFSWFDDHADDYEFAVTGIIWIEVLRGRADPNQRRHYERRLSTMRFLNQTPGTWQRAAALAWDLDRSGDVIPATDIAIAACTLDHGASILTFDRHFRRIPGLVVHDNLP